jgi:DNA-binding NarL/FixJ family response regulator
MIRVVLADDQPVLRAGLKVLIQTAPDLEVVGEADNGREAVRVATSARADVVVMDIQMPEFDGLAATQLITTNEDLAGVKVLILTTFEVDDNVFSALRAGASGFLGKRASPDQLIEAIRIVHRGDALLSPSATKSLIARYLSHPDAAAPAGPPGLLDLLTAREREILTLVAAGLSNDEIAARLVLSPATAKTHVNRAMVKLGARDRAQLVVIAYSSGLARPAAGQAGNCARPE